MRISLFPKTSLRLAATVLSGVRGIHSTDDRRKQIFSEEAKSQHSADWTGKDEMEELIAEPKKRRERK